MKDLFDSIVRATDDDSYPKIVIIKKEDAEELFQMEFQHIPDDTPGVFKIHKNGKVTGKMLAI